MNKKVFLLLILLLLLGLITRFGNLDRTPPRVDESNTLNRLYPNLNVNEMPSKECNISNPFSGFFSIELIGKSHQSMHEILTKAIFCGTNNKNLSTKIIGSFFGFLLIFIFFFFLRSLDYTKLESLMGSAFVSINPLLIFVSRDSSPELVSFVLILLSLYIYINAFIYGSSSKLFFFVNPLLISMSLLFKAVAIIYILIFIQPVIYIFSSYYSLNRQNIIKFSIPIFIAYAIVIVIHVSSKKNLFVYGLILSSIFLFGTLYKFKISTLKHLLLKIRYVLPTIFMVLFICSNVISSLISRSPYVPINHKGFTLLGGSIDLSEIVLNLLSIFGSWNKFSLIYLAPLTLLVLFLFYIKFVFSPKSSIDYVKLYFFLIPIIYIIIFSLLWYRPYYIRFIFPFFIFSILIFIELNRIYSKRTVYLFFIILFLFSQTYPLITYGEYTERISMANNVKGVCSTIESYNDRIIAVYQGPELVYYFQEVCNLNNANLYRYGYVYELSDNPIIIFKNQLKDTDESYRIFYDRINRKCNLINQSPYLTIYDCGSR